MGRGAFAIDVALAPAQAGPDWLEKVCIVVDVIRASSTIVTLFDRGCPQVFPVRAIARARELAGTKGCLIGGERDGLPLPGFDFGNSPVELQDLDVQGKSAVLTTTNGTKAITMVALARAVLIGCFLNAQACASRALELVKLLETGVGIICAGERDRFVLDDAFCAGYLVKALLHQADRLDLAPAPTDAAQAALRLYEFSPDVPLCLRNSSSGQRLLEIGREFDIEFCSRIDISTVVPLLTATEPTCFTI